MATILAHIHIKAGRERDFERQQTSCYREQGLGVEGAPDSGRQWTLGPFEGVDLSALLDRGPQTERPLFFHSRDTAGAPGFGVRRGRFKLIQPTRKGAPFELYDLEADPGERDNLALREPARVAALGQLIEQWRTRPAARATRRCWR